MKKFLSIIGLLLVSLVSCTNEFDNVIKGGEVTVINVSADEFHNSTRTVINADYSVNWSDGDMIGIFPMEDGSRQIAFDIKNGSESSHASFDGKGWGLKNGTSYAAYYPLADKATLDQTCIMLDYTGQFQTGNGSTAHLGAFDFMYSTSSTPDNGSLHFQFQHAGTLLHFQIPVAASRKYKRVTISTDGDFYTNAILNIKDNTITPVEDSKTGKLEMPLTDTSTGTDETLLNVYLMAIPVNLTGHMITANAYDEDGNAYCISWEGTDLKSGRYENINRDESVIPYVTFRADNLQTFQMSNAVESLEYSLDGVNWKNLGADIVIFGGNKILKLRGKSLTGTAKVNSYGYPDTSTSSVISFTQDEIVYAAGDIRTLVDYENYKTVDTSHARFSFLFNRCSVLASAPDLPATSLADNCYQAMFSDCTALNKAPDLPATELAVQCYMAMFCNCETLTQAPELPARTLTYDCYGNMFIGCENLAVAPQLPATTLADYCYSGMFSACLSLASAPELPATTLKPYCYAYMFADCRSLTETPKLPAKSLAAECYSNMFARTNILPDVSNINFNVESAPQGWQGLFAGTKITDDDLKKILPLDQNGKPYLPPTILDTECYKEMFKECTKITIAPELPAWTLARGCYDQMFSTCIFLKTAPELPSRTLKSGCYYQMFKNCVFLNSIKMMALDISADLCLKDWTSNVSRIGTFTKNAGANWNVTGDSGIPSGWTVQTATR